MARTGSRGGLVAFIAGLLILAIPYGRGKWRPVSTLMGILIMGGAGYIVPSNPDFMERIYQTYYEGSLSQREAIFPVAIEMILERACLRMAQRVLVSLPFGLVSGQKLILTIFSFNYCWKWESWEQFLF